MAPVFGIDGSRLGVVVTDVLFDKLLDLVDGDGVELSMLVDSNGYYLKNRLNPGKEWGGTRNLAMGASLVKDYPGVAGKVLARAVGVLKSDDDVFAYAPIEVEGKEYFLGAVKMVSVQALFADVVRVVVWTLVIVGVVALVSFSLVVTLVIERSLARLKLLAKQVKVASEEDTEIDVVGHDEVAGLASVFRETLGKLRESRQRLEERVAERTAELIKFEQAVKDAFNQVIITDVDGKIVYANPAAEKITGYSFEEMRGKTPRLWGRQMGPAFYEQFWHKIKVERKPFQGYITNSRKGGRKYEALMTVSPIVDHDVLVGFVGTELDVSREKEVERLKDEFLSMASHELRTPLTAVDGLVEMVLAGDYGEVGENLKEPLSDVNKSSKRLIELVNDLLSVSRIEAGRLEFRVSEFTAKKSVAEVVESLAVLARDKGLEIGLGDFPESVVQADVDKVGQILNNLIGNAMKFTLEGKIWVWAKTEGDSLKIFVEDGGIGIAEGDREKLFTKFEQVGDMKKKPVGTGLGLYICRQMARKMGGEVWLERSELGKGSVFGVSLPLSGTELAKGVSREIEKEERNSADQKSDGGG